MLPENPVDPPSLSIKLVGGTATYTETGSGPPLVAVHGIPGTARDFRWLDPAFEHRVRFVRVNLPGFGGTPAAHHPGPDIDGMGSFVAQLLEALDLHGVTLLGHSVGGAVVAVAAGRSDRVERVVLLASVGPIAHRAFLGRTYRAIHRLAGNRWLDCMILAMARPIMHLVGFSKRLSDPELVTAVHCVATLDFDAHARHLSTLSKPILLAWADDDRTVQRSVSEALAELLPDAAKVHFERGGHNIQKFRADKLAEAIVPWIESRALPQVAPHPPR